MNPTISPETILQKDYLTIGQLAAYLGWSTRFIEGLVRGERLPGLEIDGQWRFRRDDVVDWLEQKIQTLDTAHVTELEATMESSLVADGVFRNPHRIDRLASRLPQKGIVLDVPLTTKSEVLRALVELAESTGFLLDKDYLLASLVDRESLRSTAMPGGVALCPPAGRSRWRSSGSSCVSSGRRHRWISERKMARARPFSSCSAPRTTAPTSMASRV